MSFRYQKCLFLIHIQYKCSICIETFPTCHFWPSIQRTTQTSIIVAEPICLLESSQIADHRKQLEQQ
ncbi:hypothetical protein CICLE_v10023232mg [Citrus x clementina]|uniref:Uncharacterized protein n=1 Tax=Citrus clementina TaxID=85681 RepID=V4TXP5_CITCL|nr:hypothetical protein CICLE_v10023232mg [Citrus x clementina]